MAITGNSTILHQYTPMFRVLSPVDGQVLVFDSITQTFTNQLPNEDIDNNLEHVFLFTAVGNGSQDIYVIPWAATNPQSLFITLDGVKQQDGTYTIQVLVDQTVVTFDGVPINGEVIEMIGYEVADPASIQAAIFTADGVVGTYNIPWAALGKEMLFITVDGIKQGVNTYTLVPIGRGTQITLGSIPTINAVVEVIGLISNAIVRVHADTTVLADGFNLSGTGETVFSHTTTAGTTDVLNFKTLQSGNGIKLRTVGTAILISLDETHLGNYVNITAAGVENYDMGADDAIIGVNSNFGEINITLADATLVGIGKQITIKDEFGVTQSINDINIIPFGAQMIDNSVATRQITVDLASIRLYSNGSNWYIIN